MKTRFLFLLCLLSFPVLNSYSQESLSAEGFYFKMREKPTCHVIDVRDSASFTGLFFKQSVWLPSKEKLLTFTDSTDRDVPVFVYCAEGIRSVSAMKILIDKGFKEIYNLKKGINQWPQQWKDSENLMNKIPD